MSADPPPTLDGRLARSARTRTAVLDALLSLVAEGDPGPTALRVAERAGVALRTVYGHFADMESLYAEAGARELGEVRQMVRPVFPEDPFDVRLEQFCQDRAHVLEHLLPLMRASALREHGSPQLRRSREAFVVLGDDQVATAFAPELAGRDAAARREVLDVVHLVAGGPAWQSLRADRGLEVGAAGALLHRTLRSALVPLFACHVH